MRFSMDALPPGFTTSRTGRVTLVYREDMPFLVKLARLPSDHARPSGLSGRRAIRVVEPGMVVRTVVHGGLLRNLTGDRFLAATRSLRELETSLILADRGIPTPEILAIRITRGLLFVRLEVASRLVPEASDLLAFLEANPDDTREYLRKAGSLIRRMHDCGVYHADLHVKNLLLDGSGVLYVIDLDKARAFDRLPTVLRRMNTNRFERSVRKYAKAGRLSAPHGWELSFRAGYERL